MKNTAKRLSALILALSVVTSGATARCAEPSVIVEKVDTSSEMLVDSGALVESSKEPAQNEAGAFVVEKTEGGDLSIESAAPTEPEEVPVEPEEPAADVAEEPAEFPEEDVPALNDIETTQVAEADGCVVTAVIPAFTLPVDATLVVSALDGAAVGSDVEKVEGALDAGEEIAFVRVFDIRFVTASGEEIEPGDTVAITIELGEDKLGACDDVRVFCTDEPAAEEVGTVVTDGGVEFDAPHFSTYAVVGTYALAPVDDSAYDLKTSASTGICQVENESFTNTNVASIEFVSNPSFDPSTDAQGAYYGPVDVSANGSGMVYAYSVANGNLYDLHFVTLGSKVNLTNCRSENSPFYGLKNASYIAGASLLDTSKVTNMAEMFEGCSSLKRLDLSSFNTSKVTDMSRMFYGCRSFAVLGLSSFDTSNVTDMRGMFCSCSSLKRLDLSSFDTSSVTDMNYMFMYCTSLDSLDLSSFDTSNVTNMMEMFYECTSLDSLDLSSFNTSQVTNMRGMFCKCTSLTGLDLSSFNTSKVTDMMEMFRNCESLASLNLSSFNTSQVTNMSQMFCWCKLLAELNLSSFNTSKVTDMYRMFYDCTSLDVLDLSSFDTSQVTDMSGMFTYCRGLKSLDLSSFNTGSLSSYYDMFDDLKHLENFVTPAVNPHEIPLPKTMHLPSGTEVTTLPVTTGEPVLLSAKATVSTLLYGTNFGDAIDQICAPKASEDAPINGGRTNSNVKTITFVEDSAPGVNINEVKANGIQVDSEGYTYAVNDGSGHIKVVTEASVLKPDANATGLFKNLSGLTAVNGLELLDMSGVWSTSCMFEGCKSLTSADLSSFASATVVNTWGMFDGCSALSAVDVSPLGLQNSEQLACMFKNCSSLESVDLSSAPTIRSSSTEEMFANCTSLKTVKFANGVNTSALTYTRSMFSGCSSLSNVENLSSFDTSNVTNMACMFYGCAALEDADVSNFNTAKVEDLGQMFSGCRLIKTLDVSGFSTDSVTNLYSMFFNCSSLKTLDLSSARRLVETSGMFYGCASLESIAFATDVDTSGLTNMGDMFSGCSSLKRLDLSAFDTSNVENIWSFLSGCSSLEYLDLSSFDFSKVTATGTPFWGTTSIKIMKTPKKSQLSGVALGKALLNTSTKEMSSVLPVTNGESVTLVNSESLALKPSTCRTSTGASSGIFGSEDSKYYMFGFEEDCFDKHNVDVIEFCKMTKAEVQALAADGSHVVRDASLNNSGMVYAIAGPPEVVDGAEANVIRVATTEGVVFSCFNGARYSSPFYNCVKLKDIRGLDLFYTGEETSFNDFFGYCKALKELDLSLFDTSKVTDMSYMFRNCESLDSLDLSSFNTSKVTNMRFMFGVCSSLVELGLLSFDTSSVTDMGFMFGGCSSLTGLDLSNFNTSSVTDMGFMFCGCSSLTGLNLSSFNTSSVTDMYSMFYNCSSLVELDLSLFDTSSVTDMGFMFGGCSSLTGLDLSSFDTSKVTSMSSMFRDCKLLAGLDLSSFDTSKVTNMAKMFMTVKGKPNGVENFNTQNVTDMSGMFSKVGTSSSSWGALDLKKYDTSKVTTFRDMFSGAHVSAIDLTNFNTRKADDMSGMFSSCTELTSLDLSSFSTPDVRNTSRMFSGCKNLLNINFDASLGYVKDTSAMFQDCSSLVTINCACGGEDLTNMSNMFSGCSSLKYGNFVFAAPNVQNISYMFYGCSSLEEIDISSMELGNLASDGCTNVLGGATSLRKLVTPHSIPDPSTAPVGLPKTMLLAPDLSPVTTLPTECSLLVSEDYAEEWALGCTLKDSCTNGETSSSKIQYYFCGVREDAFMKSNIESVSFWEIPMSFNLYIDHNEYPESVALLSYVVENNYELVDVSANGQSKLTIDRGPRIGEGLFAVSVPSETTAGMYNIFVFAMEGTVFLGDCRYGYTSPFAKLTAAKEIRGLDKLNTSRCTSMGNLFDNCSLVQSLDISGFDTSKVTDMSCMFGGCRSLTSLDVSGLDTSKVTSMYRMFASVVPKPVGVEALDVSKVTDMSYMFHAVGSKNAPWEVLDLSGYNTASATNMSDMFCNARVRALDVSSFDTSKVTDMSHMFNGGGSTYLQELDVSNFDTSAVVNAQYMFGDLNGVKKIVLGPNFALPKATSLSGMFEYDFALEELDVSCIKAPNATSMSSMFVECKALKQIDLSNCDTSKVTSMSYMFNGCTALESVNLSGFNTQNVTSVAKMFYKCSSLSSVDLSDFEITTKMYNNSGSWGSVFDGSGVKEIVLPKRAERSIPLPKTFQLCNSENEITGGGTAVLSAATPAYTKALDVQPAIVTFVVPKKIEIGADGVAEYTAKVCAEQTGNLSAAAEATVAPAAQVVMSQEGKADVALDISQAAGSFNLRDTSALEGGVAQSQGRIDASGLSAGVWRGSFDFTLGLRNMTYSP